MSASLCTQTRFNCLTIQVLNTRACFIDIWYTFLTFVQYILEYGLAIVIESFSPLNLDYTTSFVKVWTRSDMISHAIPDTVYLPCTLNWFELVWTGHSQLSRCWWFKVDADVMHWAQGLESPMVTQKFWDLIKFWLKSKPTQYSSLTYYITFVTGSTMCTCPCPTPSTTQPTESCMCALHIYKTKEIN